MSLMLLGNTGLVAAGGVSIGLRGGAAGSERRGARVLAVQSAAGAVG